MNILNKINELVALGDKLHKENPDLGLTQMNIKNASFEDIKSVQEKYGREYFESGDGIAIILCAHHLNNNNNDIIIRSVPMKVRTVVEVLEAVEN
jgi:pyoverdine/dityrosine biosynthesis protein Dit1